MAGQRTIIENPVDPDKFNEDIAEDEFDEASNEEKEVKDE